MSAGTTLPVEFLTAARLGERGELTVPKGYRAALRLGKDAQVAVLRLGNGLLLIPERARFRLLCDRIARAFASHGLDETGMLATLPDARQRVFARHYPKLAKAERAHPGKTRTKKGL